MAKKHSPIHPGAFLSELLAELNITQAQLAVRLAFPPCVSPMS
jgi:plasmid maintenance system antidote protein VapI